MILLESQSEVSQELAEHAPPEQSLVRGQKYDLRLMNQDTTSVSDGESVGPVDPPDGLEPEVAEFVCTAVQEMESLARNGILVEESYQRYFMRNCGTQKEEAVWRQQGMREEAVSRQAAKAISQIHLSELWARLGYYNTEAAQRSNLFRMLLLDKRSLEGLGDFKGQGVTQAPERRRRRPAAAMDGSALHPHVDFTQFATRAKIDCSTPPALLHATASQTCRTALVHNPYSFDGPSQVSVHGTSSADASNAGVAATSAARGPSIGAMGALLKRLAPGHPTPEASAAYGPLPVDGRGAPAAAEHADPTSSAPSAPSSLLDVLKAARPRAKAGLKLPSSRRASVSSYPEAMISYTKIPTIEVPQAKDPLYKNTRSIEPALQHESLCSSTLSVEAGIQEIALASDTSGDVSYAAPSLEASDQVATPMIQKPTRRPKNDTISEEETHEDHDHTLLLTHPICNHVKYWKRLRANRGFAYFVCYRCGAKWRTSSKGARAAGQGSARPEVSTDAAAEETHRN